MNFSKHTNFKNLFSIGSGPRNLTYTVPYIAPNLTKFSADLVAVISFNRINATFPDYFCLKSYVHQVNRTHVIFSLQTDMSTNFYDLGGTVLIISPDVTSKMILIT